jgi:hypothetical protein
LKRALTATVVLTAAVAAFVWWTFPPRHLVLSTPFPDGTIPGMLHIHSNRSDGLGTLDEIARAAAAAGLKFIVVTDHGDGTRAPDPPAYRDGVLCLDAIEISTSGGHYIALGLPKAPYPLGGEARDVVEDVRRLGGFGIAAHPDSPKAELSWREWSAPIDAVEIINPDTSWRQQMRTAFGNRPRPSRLLAGRFLSYPFRPAESIAALIQPTGILDRWARAARDRRVVMIGGADAHGRIELRSDPLEARGSIPIPTYESSFRTMSIRLEPGRALTGDAAADAAIVMSAIRAGHLYTAVDGIATPPAFEFTAANTRGRAGQGDFLTPGGPVTLHVRSNAPPGFSTTVWNGAAVLAGDHHEQDFSVTAPGTDAEYWIEIRRPGQPATPWITSNPIYVRAADPARKAIERPAAIQRQPLVGAAAPASWTVEHDPTSVAAVDLVTVAAETIGNQVRFRFGLASGPSAGQYAAAVASLNAGLAGSDRVHFVVRAEQPLRVSVQLRSDRGRWQRSVYVDTTDQERTVFFDELRPVEGAATDKPPRAEIRSLLFVVDATNTKPGTSGRVWITNPTLER